MDTEEIIRDIADKDFDKSKYVEQIYHDRKLRDLIINQMISNKNIIVYYHCYEIVSEANLLKPELFYKHWHIFRNLLHHENSYHRDIGLAVIANLSKCDENNLIIDVIDEYLEHAHNEKFMTARFCIKNSSKIMLNKPELMEKIIADFINLPDSCNYPLKQKELLISDIIEAFDAVYDKYDNKRELMSFVMDKTTSSSPKTRKKAKEFIHKYQSLLFSVDNSEIQLIKRVDSCIYIVKPYSKLGPVTSFKFYTAIYLFNKNIHKLESKRI